MTFINITFAASAAGESLLSSADSVVLNIPDKKFDIRYDISLSAEIGFAFTEAKVKLNGAEIDTISGGLGGTYEIVIKADVEKYIGSNNISLDVTFADSSKKKVSEVFRTYSPVTVNALSTDMTKAPSDFPSEGSIVSSNVLSLWKGIVGSELANSNLDTKKNNFKMVNSAGDGDNVRTGRFMEINKTSSSTGDFSFFTTVYSEAFSTGKIKASYSMFVPIGVTSTQFHFREVKYTDSGTTVGKGPFAMSNLVGGKWNKLNLEFDLDSNTISYTRQASGVSDYTSGPTSFTSVETVNQFQLDFSFTSVGQSYFIESINIEHLTGQENSLLLTGYSMPDSDNISLSDANVPADAKMLTLTASDNITSADSLDIISRTGEKIQGVVFTVSGNIAEVILPDGGVPSGAFKIVLGKNTKLGGRNVPGLLSADVIFYQDTNAATSAALKVGEAVLTSAEQITSGSVIKADITSKNNKNAETKLVYVLTVRDGSRLVSMKAKSVTLPPLNEQPSYVESFSLTLPAIAKEGNYKVYLMAIDSYENCVAIDNCLAIE